jgi:hypothetical protein
LPALLGAILLSGCRVGPPKFDGVVSEYVYVSLSFQPALAAELGYQRHAGVAMGELLDDVSRAALNQRLTFFDAFEKGYARYDRSRLAPEDQIDYDLIRDRLPRDRAALGDYERRPSVYSRILERAIRVPLTVDYGPKDLRNFHLARRLEMFEPFVEHARKNLKSAAGERPDFARLRALLGRVEAEAPSEIRPKLLKALARARSAVDRFEELVKSLPPGPEPAPEAALAAPPPAPAGSSLARRALRANFEPDRVTPR